MNSLIKMVQNVNVNGKIQNKNGEKKILHV